VFAPEPPVYDPVDEEEECEIPGGTGNLSGMKGGGRHPQLQKGDAESDDGGDISDDSEWDFSNEESGDEEFDEGFEDEEWEDEGSWGLQCEQTEEESEYSKEYAEHEYRGEQVQESWDLLGRQMRMMLDIVQEIKSYPGSHRHLYKDVPMASIDNFKACFDWAIRRNKLQNMTTNAPTLGRQRQGNVFM